MNIYMVRPHVRAMIPKSLVVAQGGCNIGMIQTAEGIVVIDTSVSVKRMDEALDAAGIRVADVCLVINTHLHADHINGNSLFKCRVICHSKAKTRMAKKCAKLGQQLINFDDEYEMMVGDVHLHLFHVDGHTPESIIVWMPDERVLFSGDLIFSGRAPFLASVTNFKGLVDALLRLSSLEAEVIVPGHGPLCDEREIQTQIDYLETTWRIIKEHVDHGNSLRAIQKDPNLPTGEGANFERNIGWIYKRLTK